MSPKNAPMLSRSRIGPDYGIEGFTNKWFETCLKDRQQFVSVNGYNSECASVPIGFPQGSVLGPLLFLL